MIYMSLPACGFCCLSEKNVSLFQSFAKIKLKLLLYNSVTIKMILLRFTNYFCIIIVSMTWREFTRGQVNSAKKLI